MSQLVYNFFTPSCNKYNIILKPKILCVIMMIYYHLIVLFLFFIINDAAFNFFNSKNSSKPIKKKREIQKKNLVVKESGKGNFYIIDAHDVRHAIASWSILSSLGYVKGDVRILSETTLNSYAVGQSFKSVQDIALTPYFEKLSKVCSLNCTL